MLCLVLPPIVSNNNILNLRHCCSGQTKVSQAQWQLRLAFWKLVFSIFKGNFSKQHLQLSLNYSNTQNCYIFTESDGMINNAGPAEAFKIRGVNVSKCQNLVGQYFVIGCIFTSREINSRKKGNFSKNWGGGAIALQCNIFRTLIQMQISLRLIWNTLKFYKLIYFAHIFRSCKLYLLNPR